MVHCAHPFCYRIWHLVRRAGVSDNPSLSFGIGLLHSLRPCVAVAELVIPSNPVLESCRIAFRGNERVGMECNRMRRSPMYELSRAQQLLAVLELRKQCSV